MTEGEWEPAEGEDEPESPQGEMVPEKTAKPKATAAQLRKINEARQATGIYDAEFAALLDKCGAKTARDLTKESATFVLAALGERSKA